MAAPTVLDASTVSGYHDLVKMIVADADTRGDLVFEENFTTLLSEATDPTMCMDTDDMTLVGVDENGV
jgi:hypothetical protein